jgi:hypothetical protein
VQNEKTTGSVGQNSCSLGQKVELGFGFTYSKAARIMTLFGGISNSHFVDCL